MTNISTKFACVDTVNIAAESVLGNIVKAEKTVNADSITTVSATYANGWTSSKIGNTFTLSDGNIVVTVACKSSVEGLAKAYASITNNAEWIDKLF